MRIAVLAPEPVPKVTGGAERLFGGLTRAIDMSTPHQAVLVEHPSPERTFREVVASYEWWFGFDTSSYDLVISGKYPTWSAAHPRHHLYLLHPLRGLYDTYHLCAAPGMVGAPDAQERQVQRALARTLARDDLPLLFEALHDLLSTHDDDHPALAFPGPLIRDVVRSVDRLSLTPPAIERYSSLSMTAARRPGYLPSWVPVHIAFPPSDLDGLHAGPGGPLFTVSRLDGPKRIDLLIDAMRRVDRDVRLRIAGTGPERERLEELASGDTRIEFLGFLADADLVTEYSQAHAVPFVPLDEDFGLVALEAALSAKPVITTLDSGGAREFVRHRRTGLVVPPTADALARAIEELVDDPALADRLGRRALAAGTDVTWDGLVEAVLGPDLVRPARTVAEGQAHPAPGKPARAKRRRLVITTTFPVHPRRGGGQLRSFHLYGGLSRWFDVEIVSVDAAGALGSGSWHEFGPAFREFVAAKSQQQVAAEAEAASRAGIPVDDILAARHAPLTPAHLTALERSMDGATAVVLSHPFLAPVVRELRSDVPLIYDAHNAEVALKRLLLADSPASGELLEEVRRIEGLALSEALLLSYCSADDLPVLELEYEVVPARTAFIPNGVDTRAVPFVTGGDRRRAREEWLQAARWTWRSRPDHVAIFVASWHPPNIEAAEQILDMASELQEVLFLLVGSHCRALEHRVMPANVAPLGMVGDGMLRSLLAVADVGLNPMLRGGGSNLKVLEYLAAGLPVITTPVGARGQPAAADLAMNVVEIGGFPAAIREVVEGSADSEEEIRRGRGVIESHYDWSVLAAHLRAAIDERLPPMPFAAPPATLLLRPA